MDNRTQQLLTHFVHGLTPEEMDFVTDTIQACFLDLDENYADRDLTAKAEAEAYGDHDEPPF